MLVKITWAVLIANVLLILYLMLAPGNGQDDAAGKSMARGFVGLMTTGLLVSILLASFSRHPVALVLAIFLSGGPLLLAVGVAMLAVTGAAVTPDYSPRPPGPMPEAHFTSPPQIALARAIYNGNPLAMREAIASGAGIDTAEASGTTPMEYAFVLWRHYRRFTEVRAAVPVLLRMGVPVNKYLPSASAQTTPELVQLFLEGGADPNATDDNGESALVRALSEGNVPVAELLLQQGADPRVLDGRGRTPAMLSAHWNSWHFVVRLLEKGADYRHTDPTGSNLASMMRAVHERFTYNEKTPPADFVAAAEWLKKRGIDVYQPE